MPVVRKSDLLELQKKTFAARDPFGGLAADKPGRLARIYMSPGPIYDPEGKRGDLPGIAGDSRGAIAKGR